MYTNALECSLPQENGVHRLRQLSPFGTNFTLSWKTANRNQHISKLGKVIKFQPKLESGEFCLETAQMKSLKARDDVGCP